MTNNLDQFDQSPDFEDGADDAANRGGMKSNIVQAWRTRPIFKLIVIALLLGGGAVAFISFTGSKPEDQISKVAPPPGMNEAPGGKASPDFIAAQQQANEQRIKEAASVGGTALPTPLPSGMSTEARKEGDPLVEFRAEMKRQKEEQQRQIQALQQQSQQQQQVTMQQDQQLQEKIGASLTQQMTQLAELWRPKSMQVVIGVEQARPLGAVAPGGAATGGQQTAAPPAVINNQQQSNMTRKVKPLISAGTVNYAQMLTEANSDVPGPILAQILSGPLSGARAIGKFNVMNDLMILTFTTAVLKGKEYSIDALALDPDTTLGGMATEVDHRYFARVLLPAAASFIQAFGQKLSEKPQDTVVVQGGTVITSQSAPALKDGLYAGVASAGQNIAGFFTQEAAQTKVLVRVAIGTPMGLFFTKAVCSGEYPCTEVLQQQQTTAQAAPAKATPAAMASSSATGQ